MNGLAMTRTLSTFLIVSVFSSGLSGAMLNATPNSEDGYVNNNGGSSNGFLYTGSTSISPTLDVRTGVAIFELPALPVGETITSAEFSMRLLLNSVTNFNGDLYAVRTSSSSARQLSDGYFGPFDPTTTLIMDDYVTPSSLASTASPVDPNTIHSTDATASAALGAWLQNEYDNGAQAGDFVFLRVSADAVPTSSFDLFRFDDEGVENGATTDRLPALVITTSAPSVPEPTTCALVVLGLVPLALRRRK